MGWGPGDFTYRLSPFVAIGGCTLVGLGLGCSVARFFTKAYANHG